MAAQTASETDVTFRTHEHGALVATLLYAGRRRDRRRGRSAWGRLDVRRPHDERGDRPAPRRQRHCRAFFRLPHAARRPRIRRR